MPSSSFDWQGRNATLIRKSHALVELFGVAEMAVVIVHKFEPGCPAVRGNAAETASLVVVHRREAPRPCISQEARRSRSAAGFAYQCSVTIAAGTVERKPVKRLHWRRLRG